MCCAVRRPAAGAPRTTWRASRYSWRARRRTSSPAPPFRSTAATPCRDRPTAGAAFAVSEITGLLYVQVGRETRRRREEAMQRLKHFGWGREGEGMTAEEETFAIARFQKRFRVERFDMVAAPLLDRIVLRPPRVTPPDPIKSFASTELYDRAAHTYGKSFPDYVRGLTGDYANAPDVVAYPRTDAEVAAVLDWAGAAQCAVTPFGGGSTVVGGVEAKGDGTHHKAPVTIDSPRI